MGVQEILSKFCQLSKFKNLEILKFKKSAESSPKSQARERLRLVIIHDRSSLSPEILENLKEELLGVINKYMEINREDMKVELIKENNMVALACNIPVVQVKRGINLNPKIPSEKIEESSPYPENTKLKELKRNINLPLRRRRIRAK